ncbi:hypothetical protein ACFL0L_02095 [Patescibacteria group bacterium]
MKYNKLIRDYIPEIIVESGDEPIVHIADEKEYYQKLKEKLIEESTEFIQSDDPEELADVLEVMYAICCIHKLSASKLEKIRENKAKKRGSFSKKLILDEIT